MPPNDCPFGANDCPKVEKLEDRLIRLEKMQHQTQTILYVIVGILAVEFGIVLI